MCQAIFSTREVAQYETSWLVREANNALIPFSRDKLFISIYLSCQHRSRAVIDATDLCDSIINMLSAMHKGAELHVDTISKTAYTVLQRFDTAASTHYAAFHHQPAL
jgi:transcriptional regulator NrdR family protein